MDNHHVGKAGYKSEVTDKTQSHESIPVFDSVCYRDLLIIQKSTDYPRGKEGCEVA